MGLKTLRDLYVEELKDLYSAENQILKALPKMAKAAKDGQLRRAFEEHLEETRGHVARLEKVFDQLGGMGKKKKCVAMEGLLEEGKELMKKGTVESDALDAALITAAQKVEHYEMAGYGSVRTYARLLGEEKAAELLQQTLDEEAAADRKLTEIAERHVNARAAAPAR